MKQNDIPTNEEKSAPAIKILDVLEYFSIHFEPSALIQISKNTGIPKATLLRILNTLIDRGYISKDADKKYAPCFKLSKDDSLPASLNEILTDSLKNLIAAGCDSAEIITLNESDLFWQEKLEQQELPLRIAVKAGSRRTIHELDAPSRLFLSHIGADEAARRFETSKFYDTSYKPCTWTRAVAIFSKEGLSGAAYDRRGNSNGIRRLATLLSVSGIPFILSVAEAATPNNNSDEHIAKTIKALLRERKKIQRHIEKMEKQK